MRHMAWLHATPEGAKKARLTSFKELDEHSSFLKLPSIEGAEYLVALLSEIGFVAHTGMGAVAISWMEIESWLRTTQSELSVWELTTLKEMSEVYATELHKATAKDAAPPYVPEVEAEVEDLTAQRNAVETKLRNVFASFRRNREPEPQE